MPLAAPACSWSADPWSTLGNVNLDASAFGGNGGLSPNAPDGDGGDATTGGVGVLVTNRFQHIDQRATLTAGNVTGTAIATGGTGGLVDGLSLSLGGDQFVVSNSDATFASVALTQIADALDLGAPETFNSPVAVVNGSVEVTGDFVFSTPGTVSVYADSGTLNAQSVTIVASNFIHDDDPSRPGPGSVGTFSADSFLLNTSQDLVLDAHLISTESLNLFAPGLIDIRDATSGGDLTLQAGDTISGGTQSAAGFVTAFAPGTITLNNVNAGSSIDIESSDGDISLAFLSAGTTIDLDASGDIGFADVTADDFDFGAGGDVNGGDIIAGTEASGEAGGAVTLGDINVGILQTGGASEQGFAVGISSETSISVGDVDADEAIGFATLGNLTTGALNAGTDVMTLVGGDTTIASITTPNTGRTYHGDAQMFLDAGGPDDFDPSLVFGAIPLRSGGFYNVAGSISTGRIQVGAASITTGDINAPIGIYLDAGSINVGALSSGGDIQGFSDGSILTGNIDTSDGTLLLVADDDITTGTVDSAEDAELGAGGDISIGNASLGGGLLAAAGGNLTTGAVNANLIDATAGGLATLNGMWQAPDVELFSNDINIGASGGIDAGNTGFIRLVSTNATQALIGDGLSGTGYQLSNAEFGRLSAGNLQILARGDASATIDMLIGDLSVTGPLVGSTIDDPEGGVVFAVGDMEGETIGGVIRVEGEVTANGFTDGNSLEFYANRFELDAETGLIDIRNGTDLSGELFIDADRIHVASSSILDQLAADPNYEGHEDDLNAPAEVQRPDGVIRAGSIEVFSSNPLAVLVQNTGTADTPAGFLTFGDEPLLTGAEGQIGPIEMIINGQLITEGGTLTGGDVLDFLIDENNIGFFTENSMINGCLLTGTCDGGGGEGPLPPGFTPTPGIQDVITLIGDDPLPPPDFGNEDFIDDNDEDTEDGAGPIEPPQPLFDTTELEDPAGTVAPDVGTSMRSTPGLTETGDIDDPVSGSGNPALMETPPIPPSKEDEQ